MDVEKELRQIRRTVEENRAEALRNTKVNKQKRDKIAERLVEIEERLRNLENSRNRRPGKAR